MLLSGLRGVARKLDSSLPPLEASVQCCRALGSSSALPLLPQPQPHLLQRHESRRLCSSSSNGSPSPKTHSGMLRAPLPLSQQLSTAATVDELERALKANRALLTGQHDAAACTRAAKLCRGRGGIVESDADARLRAVVSERAASWCARGTQEPGRNARSVATILHSAAAVGMGARGGHSSGDGALVHRLALEAARLAPSLNAVEAVNCLHALAKIGGRVDVGAIAPLFLAAVREAPALNPQGATSALWACAKLQVSDASIVHPLVHAAVREAGGLTPQGASLCLWSVATLRAGDAASGSGGGRGLGAVRPLAAASSRLSSSMSPQGISNSLWALAKLGCAAEEEGLYGPLVAAAERAGPDFTPQGISMVVWALGRLLGEAPAAARSQEDATSGSSSLSCDDGRACPPSLGSPRNGDAAAGVLVSSFGSSDGAVSSSRPSPTSPPAPTPRSTYAPAIRSLLRCAVHLAPRLQARDAANCLWALGRLGPGALSPDFVASALPPLLGVAAAKAGDLAGGELATCLTAAVALVSPAAVEGQGLPLIPGPPAPNSPADHLDLSLHLSGGTPLRFRPGVPEHARVPLHTLVHRAAGLAPSMAPRDAVTCLWVCAKLLDASVPYSPSDAALICAFARAAARHESGLSPRDASSALWSLGALSVADPVFVDPLLRACGRLGAFMDVQSVANSLLAAGRLAVPATHPSVVAILQAVIRTIAPAIGEGATQQQHHQHQQLLGNCVWGAAAVAAAAVGSPPRPPATTSLPSTAFFAYPPNPATFPAADGGLADNPPITCSSAVLSALMLALSAAASRCEARITPLSAAPLLQAHAALGAQAFPLSQSVLERCWGLVTLPAGTGGGGSHRGRWGAGSDDPGGTLHAGGSNDGDGGSGAEDVATSSLPPPHPSTLPSASALRVASLLCRLMGHHSEAVSLEQSALGGLLRVDITVALGGGRKPVAVEVDGPSHFVRYVQAPSLPPAATVTQMNEGSALSLRPDGRTLLRNALLSRAGFSAVVTVPYTVLWGPWWGVQGRQHGTGGDDGAMHADGDTPPPAPGDAAVAEYLVARCSLLGGHGRP